LVPTLGALGGSGALLGGLFACSDGGVFAEKRAVKTAFDELRTKFVKRYDHSSKGMHFGLERVENSEASGETKRLAEDYLTKGVVVPPKLRDMFKCDDGTERRASAVPRIAVVEAISGTGKSTVIQRLADGRAGVIFADCRLGNAWEGIAGQLKVAEYPPTKEEDLVADILKRALVKYRSEFPAEYPIIIVDELDYAFRNDYESARKFVETCIGLYAENLATFVFIDSQPLYDKITNDANIPGAAPWCLEKVKLVKRDQKDIEEPLANYLSIFFAENNDKDSITPSALRALARDMLAVVGTQYSDLRSLIESAPPCKSPADLKREIIDVVGHEGCHIHNHVGPGSLCRALVESDDAVVVDHSGKYDENALKIYVHRGLKALGKWSDIVSEDIVHRDYAAVDGDLLPRFAPHHGAAFTAMAVCVHSRHPRAKLGKAAIDVLAAYNRLRAE